MTTGQGSSPVLRTVLSTDVLTRARGDGV